MATPGKRAGARTTPKAEKPAEDFVLHRDGTVTIVVNDEPYRMRRPKLGEYVELVEAFEEANDQILNGVVDDEADIDPETDEPRRRKLTGRESQGSDAPFVCWFERIIHDLSDREPSFERADLPPWSIMGNSVDLVVRHWRTVPLAHGSQTTPNNDALTQAVAALLAANQPG